METVYYNEIKAIYKRLRKKPRESWTREDWICSNLKMVVRLASSYTKRTGIPLDDFISTGNHALCLAADKFDWERDNVKFSTYAFVWIKAYMARLCEETLNYKGLFDGEDQITDVEDDIFATVDDVADLFFEGMTERDRWAWQRILGKNKTQAIETLRNDFGIGGAEEAEAYMAYIRGKVVENIKRHNIPTNWFPC